MQIHCPNCNTGYEIDEALIKDRARRLKCSSCGNVFTVDSLAKRPDEKDEPENPFEALSAMMTEDAENLSVDENSREEAFEEAGTIAEEETESGIAAEENAADEIVAEQKEEDSAAAPETDGDEDSDDNVDLEKIFERLSEHTEHLIDQEKGLPVYEKVWLQVKNALGFHFKIRWIYILAGAAFFVLLSLYNNR